MEVIKKDFSDVLGDKLDFNGGMACSPMHIHMREDVNVKPLNVKVARQVPLHLRDMAHNLVDSKSDHRCYHAYYLVLSCSLCSQAMW